MERRRRGYSQEQPDHLEHAWYLGSEQFRQELLQVHNPPGSSHFGEAVQEAVEVRAERLIASGFSKKPRRLRYIGIWHGS